MDQEEYIIRRIDGTEPDIHYTSSQTMERVYEKLNPQLYEMVYPGDVEENDPEEVVRVFSAHMGQKCWIGGKKLTITPKLLIKVGPALKQGKRCQIILKDLDNITEQDLGLALKVMGLKLGEYQKTKIEVVYWFTGGRMKSSSLRNYNISIVNFIAGVDALRRLGYMVPYLGIDMFNAEVAVKPEK